MTASDTFAIEVQGQGGHAGSPHETVDAVAVAAQVVTNLQQVVSRPIDPIENAVVSVTRIPGGTADNVMPETVELGGTVRAFSAASRARTRLGSSV